MIARLFRDVGQPNTGLTPAIEEIAGAVMRRLSRRSAPCLPKAPIPPRAPKPAPELMLRFHRMVLSEIAGGHNTRPLVMARCGVAARSLRRVFDALEANGMVTRERHNGRPSVYRLTPAAIAALGAHVVVSGGADTCGATRAPSGEKTGDCA